MWESLAIRLPWEQENAGSNPAIPTEEECSSEDPTQTHTPEQHSPGPWCNGGISAF
jgi:hypothetical protein